MKKTKKGKKQKRESLSRVGKGIYSLVMIAVIVFGFWGFYRAFAWTDNASTPPTNNVAAPINTGSNGQVKSGPLGIGGLSIEPGSSPNMGYIRWGDNTGWKFNFGRTRDSVGGPLNTGSTGVLMTIVDNGNVGIGTTTPGTKLQIDTGFGGVAVGGLYINNSPNPGYTALRIYNNYTNGNGGDNFSISNASGQVLKIDNNGDMTIKGKSICLSDGTGCKVAGDNGVTDPNDGKGGQYMGGAWTSLTYTQYNVTYDQKLSNIISALSIDSSIYDVVIDRDVSNVQIAASGYVDTNYCGPIEGAWSSTRYCPVNYSCVGDYYSGYSCYKSREYVYFRTVGKKPSPIVIGASDLKYTWTTASSFNSVPPEIYNNKSSIVNNGVVCVNNQLIQNNTVYDSQPYAIVPQCYRVNIVSGCDSATASCRFQIGNRCTRFDSFGNAKDGYSYITADDGNTSTCITLNNWNGWDSQAVRLYYR